MSKKKPKAAKSAKPLSRSDELVVLMALTRVSERLTALHNAVTVSLDQSNPGAGISVARMADELACITAAMEELKEGYGYAAEHYGMLTANIGIEQAAMRNTLQELAAQLRLNTEALLGLQRQLSAIPRL